MAMLQHEDTAPDMKDSDSAEIDKTHVEHGFASDSRILTGRREPPPLIKNLSAEERAVLERRLVRRVDLRLMPMIILMYIMNYLDRNNIASARVAGLQKDLGLSDPQYQVPASLPTQAFGRSADEGLDFSQHTFCWIPPYAR